MRGGAGEREELHTGIEEAVRVFRRAESLLFITGAGLSADSGLPTYRGIGGLYEETGTDEGVRIEVALSGGMMATDPALCWKYILQIEAACRGAAFNRGHEVIAEMEAHLSRVWVLTQNVDGFHRAAGSRNVIEIHGDIHELCCTACPYRRRVSDYEGLDPVPECPRCGGLLRPDVVLFGEMLPPGRVELLERELQRGFDAIVSVGTSSLFPYIARPMLEARFLGATTIEINPAQTAVSHAAELRLPGRAAPVLDALWERYWDETAEA